MGNILILLEWLIMEIKVFCVCLVILLMQKYQAFALQNVQFFLREAASQKAAKRNNQIPKHDENGSRRAVAVPCCERKTGVTTFHGWVDD